MIDAILEDVFNYIRFLSADKGLKVSICDIHEKIFPFVARLAPLNAHTAHYCMYLKKFPRIQKECVLRQLRVRERCAAKPCFYGTCYAGMDEYVFAVNAGETFLGFISAGNYCASPRRSERRIQWIAEKYELDLDQLQAAFSASVSYEVPKFETVKTLIMPLVHMLQLLYVEACREKTDKRTVTENKIFGKILMYLAENYMRDIKIDDICENLHYSRSYLSHLFVNRRNMTIMHYINDLRMTRAKELLIESDNTVSEIAFQIGFNDANYFTNTFTKFVGVSPRAYRKAHKQA